MSTYYVLDTLLILDILSSDQDDQGPFFSRMVIKEHTTIYN